MSGKLPYVGSAGVGAASGGGDRKPSRGGGAASRRHLRGGGRQPQRRRLQQRAGGAVRVSRLLRLRAAADPAVPERPSRLLLMSQQAHLLSHLPRHARYVMGRDGTLGTLWDGTGRSVRYGTGRDARYVMGRDGTLGTLWDVTGRSVRYGT